MAESSTIYFSAAVEGDVDAAVVRRLVREAGAEVHAIYGKRGKHHLRRQAKGYNQAAHFSPWTLLVDLNGDYECAPLLRNAWIETHAPLMMFQVAVRAVEAWLLADTGNLATFLTISRTRIPGNTESLEDPKRTLVELASTSRSRKIQSELVPRPGSGRNVGPAYSSRVIKFVESYWRPAIAAANSPSLERCQLRLRELCQELG